MDVLGPCIKTLLLGVPSLVSGAADRLLTACLDGREQSRAGGGGQLAASLAWGAEGPSLSSGPTGSPRCGAYDGGRVLVQVSTGLTSVLGG